MNTIVLGLVWGDEGKGKIIDLLAEDYDLVVRFSGGNNAGHSIVINDEVVVTHIMPTGIRYNCLNIIGNGCVIDIEQLLREIKEFGATSQTLQISERAHIITPAHRYTDEINETSADTVKIGTTKRGIGPCYADKIARHGIQLQDIYFKDWKEKFLRHSQFHGDAISNWMSFVDDTKEFLRPFITDVKPIVYRAERDGKDILYEGAQGTFLDIDHGTYPFVTSSNTTIGAAYTGVGVYLHFGKRIGVVKAYNTRIGTGPFPTELSDETGVQLREIGKEYGATTGRPRRCGWLDLPMIREAVMINGINTIALTKLDCLTGLEKVKVAINHFNNVPFLAEFEGWKEDIHNIREFKYLPVAAQRYVKFIENFLQVPVGIISVGPERDSNIYGTTI